MAHRTCLTSRWTTLLPMLALLLGGCSTLRGTPERYQSGEAVVKAVDLTPEELAALVDASDKLARNRTQNRALAVIDRRYNAFVADLAADRADSASTVAGTTLAASTAGAFVDSVKAKTNYALFAAGFVGAFGIVDKNYFYDKTVPALIGAMRAARSRVLLRIRQGQQEDVDAYDGVLALQDIDEYFAAGTLLGAIADVSARADESVQETGAALRALSVPTPDQLSARRATSQAILGIKTDADMAKGNKALSALGLPAGTTPKETRAALVAALRPRTAERIAVVEQALRDAALLP